MYSWTPWKGFEKIQLPDKEKLKSQSLKKTQPVIPQQRKISNIERYSNEEGYQKLWNQLEAENVKTTHNETR